MLNICFLDAGYLIVPHFHAEKKLQMLLRVAKCQGFWESIPVKMFASWGKKFGRTYTFAKLSLFGKILLPVKELTFCNSGQGCGAEDY